MNRSLAADSALRLGGLSLDNKLLLAPMAGYTDSPFRLICREFGCGLTSGEMISAKGLIHRNRRTFEMLSFDRRERPISIQIFGSDPDDMAEAVVIIKRRMEGQLPDVLDINMGCPTPKIVKNGDGAALMTDPDKAGRVVERVVKAADGAFPVTVKIRKGWDDFHQNAVEIGRIAERAGASAITVHGRTREQFYRGKADWDVIGLVKSSVGVPVIGNGDVTKPDTASRMLDYTGCDGVMIGRGALGNPWIFETTLKYFHNPFLFTDSSYEFAITSDATRIRTCLHHLQVFLELRGERWIKEMRKHVVQYLKGVPGSATARKAVYEATTGDEFRSILESLLAVAIRRESC